ncbi:MAG TPA: hypothetical protein ENI52_01305 [Thermoplasmata archaeon]|nr:hypothetical protein [Thermoplasmata archaeon]
MKKSGYIVVTFSFYQEGKRWVAYCEELGTATFGDSLPEAQRKLSAAVLCHLNTLEDVGERERFFRKYGIKFYEHKPKQKERRITVPLGKDKFIKSFVQKIPACV